MKGKNLHDILKDPATFFEAVTGHKPEEWQRFILTMDLRDGQQLACLIARRSGKTLTLAIKILYECIVTPESAFRCILLAPSKEQAAFVYGYIRDALLTCPPLVHLRQAYFQIHRRKLGLSERRLEIPTRGGKGLSRVVCLAGDFRGNAAYLVGDRADILVVDEAALLQDGTFSKISKCTTTGNYRSTVLMSTPRQDSGFFYRACRPKADDWDSTYNGEYLSRENWTVIHRDVEHVHHVRDNPRIWRERRRDMRLNPDDVQTEYYAHFESGSGKFFDSKSIDLCTARNEIPSWAEWIGKASTQNPIICCIDLAIADDESVVVWFYATGRNHLTVIHVASFKRDPDPSSDTIPIKSYGDIVAYVVNMKRHGLRPRKVYVDITNEESFEDMLQGEGFKTEGIHWSAMKKNDLMWHARDCIRAEMLTLPPQDQSYHARMIHEQLRKYSFDITEHGNYQFNIRQDLKRRRKKWSDDYVSALAMGCQWLNQGITVRPITVKAGGGKNNQWDGLTVSETELRALAVA